MALTLVVLVTALAPACSDTSSPRAIASSDGSSDQSLGLAATVTVTFDSSTVAVGSTARATVVAKNSRGTVLSGKIIRFALSDTSIAKVAEGGRVVTKKAGVETLTATVDQASGKATLTVGGDGTHISSVPVANVAVTLDSTQLTVPHTAQASATLRDSNGNVLTGSVAWSSSSTSVATVSSTGVVTAVAAGTASIVGTSGTVTGNVSITIVAAPVKPVVTTVAVALDSTKLTVPHTGMATATLRDQNGNVMSGSCTWSSSNAAVATVSSAGVVTAVGVGTASIIATYGSITGTASITIAAAPPTAPTVASVTVALDSTQLTVSHTSQAKATLKDSAGNVIGGSVTWSSSNTGIATVASTGVVTAVAAGTAQIVGTSGTVHGQAPITVVAAVVPVATVSVTLASSSINVGANTQATATTKDASGNVLTGRPIAWSSSNPAVAAVNASTGVVTGVAGGNAAITATSNGKTGSATITIVASPPPVGGQGALSGQVADVNGAVVGGGVVEILSGSTVVQTVAVASNGTYSVPSLAAGNYNVRLQPPLSHSMGPAEPPSRPVTVSGSGTTQSFVVQPAVYYDNFQAYGSTSAFTGGYMLGTNIPLGLFGYTPYHNVDIGTINNSPFISQEPNDGFGKRALRYDWPAQPNHHSDWTVSIQPRLNPPPAMTNMWVRFTSRETPNFEHGASNYGRAYKFFLVGFESGPTMGRFGTYLVDGGGPAPLATSLATDITDNFGPGNVTRLDPPQAPVIGASSWGGAYHTWVMEFLNMGTTNCTHNVYLDGKLIATLTGPFMPGAKIGAGWAVYLEMGANMNSGPDFVQSRWWRELAVYSTRPSFLPMVP